MNQLDYFEKTTDMRLDNKGAMGNKALKENQDFKDYLYVLGYSEKPSKNFKIKDDNEWVITAHQWSTVKKKIRKLEQEEEELRKKMIDMTEEEDCMGAGVVVKKVVRKGSIDYKAIPDLKEKNLDIYRKDNIEFWQIEEQ